VLRLSVAPLLHAISAAAITIIENFRSQELNNLAWSCAALVWKDATLS